MCVGFFYSVECLKNKFLSSLEENKLKKETDRTRQNKKDESHYYQRKKKPKKQTLINLEMKILLTFCDAMSMEKPKINFPSIENNKKI
jgi:hypothetical protein